VATVMPPRPQDRDPKSVQSRSRSTLDSPRYTEQPGFCEDCQLGSLSNVVDSHLASADPSNSRFSYLRVNYHELPVYAATNLMTVSSDSPLVQPARGSTLDETERITSASAEDYKSSSATEDQGMAGGGARGLRVELYVQHR
jgi:hypothetical protein